MKKIILVNGLIAGAIVSTFMVISIAYCYSNSNFEGTGSMLVGYASMLLSFSLVFVGVKTYRDKYNGGVITFGQAFKVAFYIALLASTIYVIVWMIDYNFFMPDFLDRYNANELKHLKASGASAAEISKKTAEAADMAKFYKNPLGTALFTYMEILPVGLVVSLFSALILKRNTPNQEQAAVA